MFVIGGNGSGIPYYRKLQRQGIPFAAGVLHTNDVDCQVAGALADQVITEKPFESISQESYDKAVELMKKMSESYLSSERLRNSECRKQGTASPCAGTGNTGRAIVHRFRNNIIISCICML